MKNIYLTENANRCEPAALAGIAYTHVKCRTDGSQTLIVAPQAIEAADCVPLSRDDAQALLNSWIDEENTGVVPDEQGNLMTQSRIDLGAYLT